MKSYIKIGYLLGIASMLSANAFGYYAPSGSGIGTSGKGKTSTPKAAACSPATKSIRLDFNDVSAIIENGGNMFSDRNSSPVVAAYEVPKTELGNGPKMIYAGALWMGGKDINGQLKIAALKFRQDGEDFWPGPLSTTEQPDVNYDPRFPVGDDAVRPYGPATIDESTCLAYDRFYTISKAAVVKHIIYSTACGPEGTPEDCEAATPPSNEELAMINEWPAHGDETKGHDHYLAPFRDLNDNTFYEPELGEYPWYDDILGRDDVECGADRRVTLFGDYTVWWVFNDKGNIHTETNGDPIGMEIRAQAFSFATSDEINLMTFYNYELINRSTQTLQETYFSQYMDADVGAYNNDYVGCDVSRGLGYAYNGELTDISTGGAIGWGENVPAIGVDFFEGPYQDADGKDNVGPVYDTVNLVWDVPTVAEAILDDGIVYTGIGIGYGDGVIDNERFGMRRFTYYSGGAAFPYTDPSQANQYYNYMQGLWQDGSEMYYGGRGNADVTTIQADYLLPGDSDPLNWSTKGIDPGFDWDEQQAGNQFGDRRFVQAAGPFTLRPGAVNNLTVGVVFGRSYDGGLLASVEAMKQADTKAQALFDNCFRIVSPPDAPKLDIQELENELILTLSNPATSNNYKEAYNEFDNINIAEVVDGEFLSIEKRSYIFEGYQIFQMVDDAASVSDIGDESKARLVAQCDIENDITRIVNFEFNEQLGFDEPKVKVDGENKGIRHSFQITEDKFAQNDKRLVNHKTYYYIAIAYGFNQFKEFDPNDPDKLNGQKLSYNSSRLSYDGTAIRSISAVPHSPMPEAGGTIQLVEYGTTPEITRLDGVGNGNRSLELTSGSIASILANGHLDKATYTRGNGPINVKVVDPLNVTGGYYTLKFNNYTPGALDNTIDTASWTIYRYEAEGSTLLDSVTSDQTIARDNEQVIPEWGVSVQIFNKRYDEIEGTNLTKLTAQVINSSVEFADSSKRWLSFINDGDSFYPSNWIGSGAQSTDAADCLPDNGIFDPCLYNDFVGIDPDQDFEKVVGGGVSPHRLTRYEGDYMPLAYVPGISIANPRSLAANAFLPSVDIVLTDDKTKWTRCPVIEMGRESSLNVGGAEAGEMRASQSVDKNGNPDGTGNGMGWFPGYAIDLETGSRLHMAFGEYSFLGADGGADMIWNPTSRVVDGTGTPIFGGLHTIWVFGNRIKEQNAFPTLYNLNYYDPSVDVTNNRLQQLLDIMQSTSSTVPQKNDAAKEMYGSLMWVVNPILATGEDLLSTQATIKIRMNKEYKNFSMTDQNGGRPMYSWNMDDLATEFNSAPTLSEVLDIINIVPNPYYAFSEYERSRLETKVKVTNLPEKCTVRIYTTGGKLVNKFEKDSPVTSLDWDLTNNKNIPVASGIYLIHVEVPEIGERVLKFFCGVRQVDLEGI